MKKSLLILIACILTLIPFASSTCVYYFYGDGCPHCVNVARFLNKIEVKYPNVDLKKFETWGNYENSEIFDNIFNELGVMRRGVPAVVIGDDYLMGDTPIIKGLERLIDKNKGVDCPGVVQAEEVNDIAGPESEPNVIAEEKPSPAMFYFLIALTIIVVFYLVKTVKKN